MPWPSCKLASENDATAVAAASDGVGQPLVARESIALRAKADKRPVSSSTLPPASISTSLRAELTHGAWIYASAGVARSVDIPAGCWKRAAEAEPG